MSVWFCIPSARPPEQVEPVLAQWSERGYKIALWTDSYAPGLTPHYRIRELADIQLDSHPDKYPGYAQAVNKLADYVLKSDPYCDWIVTGGDDTLPDPNHTADTIASQMSWFFNDTFGIMQPTGDRFAGGCIDRIAGSPWLGREWCLRANGGRGPFWPEFTHMFGDECMKRTAEKLGVYWARPDLIHKHNHFQRESDALDSQAVAKPVPEHLRKWNTPQHWDEMKAIFKKLEAEDFKSCMPL